EGGYGQNLRHKKLLTGMHLRIRLMMAEQLLHDTALSVLEISERCGFPCLSTFNRQFLRRNGISLREFRKRE
ncbi:MAG: AraC family transcriptional regulator, partial [Clostridia bacterium]|nr:AraC family transcriptional regulator [Clostridia bacterium]